jgi:hypothetical protein
MDASKRLNLDRRQYMMRDWQLFLAVVNNNWTKVEAMVAPELQSVLLDVVFTTESGQIVLKGKAHSLRDQTEAFSLECYEHIREGWWADSETEWKPRILSEEWKEQSLTSVLIAPREVCYYFNPRLKERMFQAKNVLDNCSAIMFDKIETIGKVNRIVLVASDDYPCAIEIGTTEDECASLLNGLERVTIPTFPHSLPKFQ